MSRVFRDRIWDAFQSRQDKLAAAMTAELTRAFDEQRRRALSRLDGMSFKSLGEHVTQDSTEDKEKRKKLLLLLLLNGMLSGAMESEEELEKMLNEQVGSHEDGELPTEVVSDIGNEIEEARQYEYLGRVIEGYGNRMAATIDAAVESGMNLEETAQIVEAHHGHQEAEASADRIAQTEMAGWFNMGAYRYFGYAGQQGVVTSLEWMSKRDDRVRPTHQEADGQVIPLGGLFVVGGYQARFPGDPILPPEERCNCRCIPVPVF